MPFKPIPEGTPYVISPWKLIQIAGLSTDFSFDPIGRIITIKGEKEKGEKKERKMVRDTTDLENQLWRGKPWDEASGKLNTLLTRLNYFQRADISISLFSLRIWMSSSIQKNREKNTSQSFYTVRANTFKWWFAWRIVYINHFFTFVAFFSSHFFVCDVSAI